MTKGTFRLVAFDEGGVAGPAENRRLVCVTDTGGKLAVWGTDRSRHNIDAILRAGLPCAVECEWRPPNPIQAERFGHTQWVREDCALSVLT